MNADTPVDGFAIAVDDGQIQISFSNRYGAADIFQFTREDAIRIAESILEVAKDLED